MNLTTRKATVTFTGTSNTTGVAAAYKWYRNGVAIVGATASSYTLLTTDTNKSITVVVIYSKAGFTSKLSGPVPGQLVNGFTQGEPAVIVGTVAVGNSIKCVPPLYYKADGSPYWSFRWARRR